MLSATTNASSTTLESTTTTTTTTTTPSIPSTTSTSSTFISPLNSKKVISKSSISTYTQDIESAVRVIRESLVNLINIKDTEVLALQSQLHTKEAEAKEWMHRSQRLETQLERCQFKIQELSTTVKKLTAFKQHIYESFMEDHSTSILDWSPKQSYTSKNSSIPLESINNDYDLDSTLNLKDPERDSSIFPSPLIKLCSFPNTSSASASASHATDSKSTLTEELSPPPPNPPPLIQPLSHFLSQSSFTSSSFDSSSTKSFVSNDFDSLHLGAKENLDSQVSSPSSSLSSSNSESLSRIVTPCEKPSTQFVDTFVLQPTSTLTSSSSAPIQTLDSFISTTTKTRSPSITSCISSSSSSPSAHIPILQDPDQKKRHTVDGREFFKLARQELSYDEFSELLHQVKLFNARQQSRQQTLENLEHLLACEHPILFDQFKSILAAHSITSTTTTTTSVT